MVILSCLGFFFLIKKFFKKIDFIFRGEGRERNIDWLPLAQLQLGTWLKTQACTLTRIELASVCGMTPNQLSYTSQGRCSLFYDFLFKSVYILNFFILEKAKD